jgi:hypothetical protein
VTESDTHRRLRAILDAAAEAHHDVDEEPGHDWARWYAEYLHREVVALTQSHPSLETLIGWLREADTRYGSEGSDADWPDRYATWILEWDGAAAS